MYRILTTTLIVMAASNAVIAQERLLSRQVIEPVMKRADCDVPVQQALDGQNVDVLDAGHKLVEVYYWRAAYNFGSLYCLAPLFRTSDLVVH